MSRLIFGIRRSEHITDALASLHWLRVPERILFKVAVLTYRALHGSAPLRLRICRPISPASLTSHLDRDYDHPRLSMIVPSFNLATVSKRAFPVSAANLWNSLPTHLASAPSLAIFRQRLKTFLFRRSYPDLIL